MGLAALMFLCGAGYEAGCVGFIHFSERGRPLMTALCSMVAAAVQLTGVLESVHDWHLAPVFILGYGTGSYIAVRIKGMLEGK